MKYGKKIVSYVLPLVFSCTHLDNFSKKYLDPIANNKYSEKAFVVENSEEEIKGKDEKKNLKDVEEKRVEYKIEKISFDEKENLLNIYAIKNSYLDIFNEGFIITRDKFEVKTKKENYFGALPLGIGGILGVTGLTMMVQYFNINPSKGCPDEKDYPQARNRCINEHKKQIQSYLNLSFIPLSFGGIFSGLGFYYSQKDKRVSYKDTKLELRNSVIKNIKELKETKLIKKKVAQNLDLKLSNDYLFFDDKEKELKVKTDEDGEAVIEIKSINKTSFFNKKEFYTLKQVKDLKDLGLEKEIKDAYNHLASEIVSIIITTEAKDGNNDNKELKLNLYKLGSLETLF